ncbi:MAG: molecular chaperone HtpG, partial [Hyphomonadaceae bacterium]|nr:molecular chaperone HtpG [Clostridia bacterium]
SFMVAGRVTIDTLSYQEGADAVQWASEDGTAYELGSSERTERGTTITLYLDDDNTEFLQASRVREVLNKYCSFLPVEIYLVDLDKPEEEPKEGEVIEAPKPINDTQPLWTKNPNECTDEEYKEFYRKVFMDFNEPLFWIHLNVDYPFNLQGILYFPKLKHEFEGAEGQIKLYNNQVFVADNIKEVIPEFLMLLKGVIDCPDLPLNVSRSFLQNDGYVKKVSQHITKKISDKLTSLFNSEREAFNGYWDDIHPFIKYGCLRDEKFFEKVKDILLFKTTKGEYITMKDYAEQHDNKIFYTSNDRQQAQYIRMFEEQGVTPVVMQSPIDNHFLSFYEMHVTGVKFNRIDADISDHLKETEAQKGEHDEKLSETFKELLNNANLKIEIETLKSTDTSAVILLSEQSRRMQEMSMMFGGGDMRHMFPEEQTLVLNRTHPLMEKVLTLGDEHQELKEMIVKQVYDLAMMSHKPLDPEAMTSFIARSNEILKKLA